MVQFIRSEIVTEGESDEPPPPGELEVVLEKYAVDRYGSSTSLLSVTAILQPEMSYAGVMPEGGTSSYVIPPSEGLQAVTSSEPVAYESPQGIDLVAYWLLRATDLSPSLYGFNDGIDGITDSDDEFTIALKLHEQDVLLRSLREEDRVYFPRNFSLYN